MIDQPDSTERAYHARRPFRPGLGVAVLLLLGCGLAAFALEAGARVARVALPEKGGYSPVRGHRSREPMNTAGYRDVEHNRQKAPGVHRAVFVGDSFTYGVGVLFDDTYPKRTERALSSERSEKWESVVLAVPGIDAEEEATIVENEALAYEPDVLIVGFVLNDAEDPNSAERRRAADWTKADADKRNPPFWRHSAFLSFVADRLHATRENRKRIENYLALYQEKAPGFLGARRALNRMAKACRDHGVPFVVALFPLLANPLDDAYPFATIHAKVAVAVGQATGATFVDLLPYYRGMDWRLLVVEGARDEHPNEIAHRIAAQALLRSIESVLPWSSSGARGC